MHIHLPSLTLISNLRRPLEIDGRLVHLAKNVSIAELASMDIYPLEEDPWTASGAEEEYELADGVVTKRTPAPSLEERKVQKKAEVAAQRWEAQHGGIEVGGMQVRTDQYTMFMLNAARGQGDRAGGLSMRWKQADGSFTTLNKPQIDGLHQAVFEHVQACFQQESDLVDAIDVATTVAELETIQWT